MNDNTHNQYEKLIKMRKARRLKEERARNNQSVIAALKLRRKPANPGPAGSAIVGISIPPGTTYATVIPFPTAYERLLRRDNNGHRNAVATQVPDSSAPQGIITTPLPPEMGIVWAEPTAQERDDWDILN